MAYTKPLFISSWTSARNIWGYLQNPHHPHHEEYDLDPMRSATPRFTPENFLAEVQKTFAKLTAGRRGGRPIKNWFELHISRVPDMTWLTPQERDEYAEQYIRRVAPDRLVTWCWHVNWLTGSADLNVMIPNFVNLDHPRVRRQSNINPITHARKSADAVVEIINAQRRQKGERVMVNMPERIRQIADHKRGSSLERQLAEYPETVTMANLKAIIQKLGHQVTEYDEDTDLMRIKLLVPEDGKRKRRKRAAKKPKATKTRRAAKAPAVAKAPKAPQFAIIQTLDDVTQLREQLRTNPQPSLPKPKRKRDDRAHDTPKDEELHRLIDEVLLEQALSPKQAEAIDHLSDEEIERPPEPPEETPPAPGRSW